MRQSTVNKAQIASHSDLLTRLERLVFTGTNRRPSVLDLVDQSVLPRIIEVREGVNCLARLWVVQRSVVSFELRGEAIETMADSVCTALKYLDTRTDRPSLEVALYPSDIPLEGKRLHIDHIREAISDDNPVHDPEFPDFIRSAIAHATASAHSTDREEGPMLRGDPTYHSTLVDALKLLRQRPDTQHVATAKRHVGAEVLRTSLGSGMELITCTTGTGAAVVLLATEHPCRNCAAD